ncbi:hypothetical protein [Amantichitinum ursilacus]|uniref:Uncharacterized protein n=1 Tax=Amantichitinum ursilacus TaxID=857265 RepID=A0A0N0GQK0_9NEIS|nr:hypothetical protein [Amantichitinum ursilacus]KPC54763.1 hypothetical protein WG78_04300 [Amantichitinum ursilacus]
MRMLAIVLMALMVFVFGGILLIHYFSEKNDKPKLAAVPSTKINGHFTNAELRAGLPDYYDISVASSVKKTKVNSHILDQILAALALPDQGRDIAMQIFMFDQSIPRRKKASALLQASRHGLIEQQGYALDLLSALAPIELRLELMEAYKAAQPGIKEKLVTVLERAWLIDAFPAAPNLGTVGQARIDLFGDRLPEIDRAKLEIANFLSATVLTEPDTEVLQMALAAVLRMLPQDSAYAMLHSVEVRQILSPDFIAQSGFRIALSSLSADQAPHLQAIFNRSDSIELKQQLVLDTTTLFGQVDEEVERNAASDLVFRFLMENEPIPESVDPYSSSDYASWLTAVGNLHAGSQKDRDAFRAKHITEAKDPVRTAIYILALDKTATDLIRNSPQADIYLTWLYPALSNPDQGIRDGAAAAIAILNVTRKK